MTAACRTPKSRFDKATGLLPSKQTVFAHVAGILVLGLLLYAPVRKNQFVFNDMDRISTHAALDEIGGIGSLFSPSKAAELSGSEYYGPIATLVDVIDAKLEDTSLPRWQRTMAVNTTGAYLCCRAALPHLIEAGQGSIVNISSVQATRGFSRCSAYAASKAAMLGMARSLASELAPHRIRVNCISPGPVATRFGHNCRRLEPEFFRDKWADAGDAVVPTPEPFDPTPRLLTSALPIDIAQAALFLASDEAACITGHDLVVDGGLSIKMDK